MAPTWFVIKSTQIRVSHEGKQVSLKVDTSNVNATIDQLQERTGWLCPLERREEIVSQCCEGGQTNEFAWLQGITIPNWYMSASKDSIQRALETGIRYLEQEEDLMKRELLAENVKQIETQLKNEFANTQQQYETKIRELEEQVAKNEKQMRTTFEEAKKLAESIHIQHLEKQLKEERERYEAVVQHKSKLNNNKLAGNVGERIVYSWLRDAFTGIAIEDVSAIKHKMDFCFEWKGVKVGVDAKNHATKVDKDDVEKFHNDMDTNKEYDVGILVATTGTIPKTNGWIDVRLREDGRLIVYMSALAENPVERLQLVLGSVIEPAKALQKRLQEVADRHSKEETQEWIQQAREEFKNTWQQAQTLQTSWLRTQRHIEKAMKEFSTEVVNLLVGMNKRLEQLEVSTEQTQPTPQQQQQPRKKPGPKGKD